MPDRTNILVGPVLSRSRNPPRSNHKTHYRGFCFARLAPTIVSHIENLSRQARRVCMVCSYKEVR